MKWVKETKNMRRSIGTILLWQGISYGYLTCGALIQGIGMALFLFPNSIPSGGAAGIAILLNYLLHISLGKALWFSNLVSLSLALKFFGYEWTLRTIYSVSVTSFTVHWVTNYWPPSQLNIGIDILFGALFFGIGVGILIRYGASSGGMVVLALILAMYKEWTPGKAMFWINISIFIVTAVVIDLKIVIYAIVCQWLSTRLIDFMDNYKMKFPFLLELAWRRK